MAVICELCNNPTKPAFDWEMTGEYLCPECYNKFCLHTYYSLKEMKLIE